MQDWQKMSIYNEAHLEDMRLETQRTHFYEAKPSRLGRVLVLVVVLFLGLLVWWIY